jgi:hypothetical protein
MMGGIARVPSTLLDEPSEGDWLYGWRLDRRWSALGPGVGEGGLRSPDFRRHLGRDEMRADPRLLRGKADQMRRGAVRIQYAWYPDGDVVIQGWK